MSSTTKARWPKLRAPLTDVFGFAILTGPVVGEFEKWRLAGASRGLVFVRRQEDEGEATGRVLDAVHFHHAEQITIEMKGRFDVRDANHRVQVFHWDSPGW